MDIRRHKKTLSHILITMMLLLLPVVGIAAPQQADITKPTRERVKSTDKKSADNKTTSKKDDKKNTAAQKKDDKKDAVAATTKKDNKKDTTTPKKDNKKDDNTPKKDNKSTTIPNKDGKATVKKDDKPAPSTLLSNPNDNKGNDNKPVQDTTGKAAKAEPVAPKKPPVNTETTQFDGIDVSKHQGNIDWDELKKNSKIKFVYVKATEGSDYVDPKYKENIKNARRSGFKVGSYHYLTNRSSATNQFRNFVRNVNREEQDLLPVIDVEEVGKWTSQQLRDSLKVFADLLEDYYGCKPVIYTSEKFFIKHLGRSFAGYPLFIAKYNTSTQPDIGYRWIIWQFSDRGYFKGVKGNHGEVDLSRFNKGCSINDLIYKPSQHKPKASVMDAVDHKEKPATINATEQKPKENSKQSSKQKAEQQKKAEKEAKIKEQQNKRKAQEEANKKAKEEEAAKKAKQKAEQQKREKERQEAAKKAADDKAKRKADAQKARQEKAKQEAASKTKKGANVRGALTQSQRNDSIRAAQQSGRKINKSSADND